MPSREAKPKLTLAPVELAAAPALEVPAPAAMPREVRVVRVAREEVHTHAPGAATAHVFVVGAQGAQQPHPAEIARAIKAARASGTQVADARELLQRLRITIKTQDQGE
jgi:hypothetical protein